MSYTRAPERVKLLKDQPHDPHVSFLELARLSTSSARREVIQYEAPFVSEGPLQTRLHPDEHLMVVDFAYYVGMVEPWEWIREYYEPWRVASHAHWTPKIRSLADNYLMRHFGVDTVKAIPKVSIPHGMKKHLTKENILTVYIDPRPPR